MKTAFVLVAMIGLLGLAAIGPSVMAHDANHSGNCPVAFMNGSTCQMLQSFLGHLSSAVSSIQGIAQHSGIMSLLFALVLVGVALSLPNVISRVVPVSLLRTRRERLSDVLQSLSGFFRFNSLLEHSPTLT